MQDRHRLIPLETGTAGADRLLRSAAVACSVTFLMSLWVFVFSIVGYYGPIVLEGGLPGLNDTRLARANVPGETIANLSIAVHLLTAAFINGLGCLQFIPVIRRRWPAVHRWNGRAFMLMASVASLTGLYMVWIRGSAVGGIGQHVGLSINAVLMIVFVVPTLRHARARRIIVHRRWAMRLFLSASGAWMHRIVLWLWIPLTGGAGINRETFDGPFLTVLYVLVPVIPLGVYELYWRVRQHGRPAAKLTLAAVLAFVTIGTIAGTWFTSTNFLLVRM